MLAITQEMVTTPKELLNISVENEYRAIQSSAGITQKAVSFLEIQGPDAPDFLHRMSTNDVLALKPNQVCLTVLTTEKARIVDLVTVINLGERLLLVCSQGNSSRVKEWLEKFIIMEDIQIIDVTSRYSMLAIIGPQVKSFISNFLKTDLSKIQNSVLSFIEGKQSILYSDSLWPLLTFNVILDRKDLQFYRNNFFSELSPIGTETVETLRIEQGVPILGKGLTEQVNPLESGLEKCISFTKGCYIGQEVIARLDTYKKLQKKLSGFVFNNKEVRQIPTGKLYLHGNEVGWTTSQVWSFKLKKFIALGYLKTTIVENEFEFAPNEWVEKFMLRSCEIPFQA